VLHATKQVALPETYERMLQVKARPP
jgi:hypothetical protein